MYLATTMRYMHLPDSKFWDHRYFLMNEFEIMVNKLGFGLCAIMSETDLDRFCDQCDGLLLPGTSTPTNPKYYGGPDIPPDVDEYALDQKLIQYFFEHNKPIFGLCGGQQRLNIYFGGTIRQVKDPVGHPCNIRHHINIKKDSFVWDVFGNERVKVNSFHGCALDKIAPCFDVVATADDGEVEAIEWKEKKIFATQWHPERSYYDTWENEIEQKFFENFLEICRQNGK